MGFQRICIIKFYIRNIKYHIIITFVYNKEMEWIKTKLKQLNFHFNMTSANSTGTNISTSLKERTRVHVVNTLPLRILKATRKEEKRKKKKQKTKLFKKKHNRHYKEMCIQTLPSLLESSNKPRSTKIIDVDEWMSLNIQ